MTVVPVHVRPACRNAAVIESGSAKQLHGHGPAEAACRPHQAMLGREVTRSPAPNLRRRAGLVPRTNQQRVAHTQPPRRGLPRRLQHKRARKVPPGLRDHDVGRPQAKRSRATIQDRPEDTGRVRPGQAHPFDRPAWRNQGVALTVGEKTIVGDPGKWALPPDRPALPAGSHRHAVAPVFARFVDVPTSTTTRPEQADASGHRTSRARANLSAREPRVCPRPSNLGQR